MKHLQKHEEQIIVIAVMLVVIIFLYLLIVQLMDVSIISSYDVTATAGAELFFQQLTAQP